MDFQIGELMVEEKKKEYTHTTYEIKLQGHLDSTWSEWFYDMAITHDKDGISTICGPLPDQAVLHSVLERIRDMNLLLISVNQIVSDGQTIKFEIKGVSHEE
jgi:hypothetical protein